jgi:hypothetical protein
MPAVRFNVIKTPKKIPLAGAKQKTVAIIISKCPLFLTAIPTVSTADAA